METATQFIFEYGYVYVWLALTTFINIIAPLPGTLVVNPIIAYATDPQRAIGIGALIFACTGFPACISFEKSYF